MLIRSLLLVLLSSIAVAQRPCPTCPENLPKRSKPGFFTIYPDRPFKKTLKSPWFVIPELVAWGVTIADAKKNNCVRGNLCGTDMWEDAFIPAGVVSGFHFLSEAKFNRAIGLGAISYVIAFHTNDLVTGKYH